MKQKNRKNVFPITIPTSMHQHQFAVMKILFVARFFVKNVVKLSLTFMELQEVKTTCLERLYDENSALPAAAMCFGCWGFANTPLTLHCCCCMIL